MSPISVSDVDPHASGFQLPVTNSTVGVVSETNKWGIPTGAVSSPPPAPSSGTSVRRNHTIHGARHHAGSRLERHFEQPENNSNTLDVGTIGQNIAQEASSNSSDLATDSGSSPSSTAAPITEFSGGLTPLQSLYVKSNVSRNHSLPNRHSSKLLSSLPVNATQGRTSLFNSLSAITGGADVDEHDWEKLIRSDTVLDNGQHAASELPVPSLKTETPWSDSIFDHSRFPSGPASAHQHSPVARTEYLADPHHLRGSSMAMDALDVGAFTSSPTSVSSGYLRRHQSLNHNSGRPAANRLAARNDRVSNAASITPSSSARLEYPFSPERQAHNFSAAGSPVAPIGHARMPWNVPPSQDVIGSPSRYAGSFPSQNLNGIHNQVDAFADPSTSSMLGIHTGLSKLDITGSAPSQVGSVSRPSNVHAGSSSVSDTLPMRPSLVSRGSASSIDPGMERRLPSLVTNREDLQKGVGLASVTQGPASASASVPPIGHRHLRQQSHDPFSSHQNLEYDASRRFGPYTSGPQGQWHDKERISGRSGAFHHATPAQNYDTGAYRFDNDMDPNMRALSMALAHEQQKNAILQAQLGVQSQGVGPQDAHIFGMTSMNQHTPAHSISQQLRVSGPGGNTTGHPNHRMQASHHHPRAPLGNQHGPAGAANKDSNDVEGSSSATFNRMPVSQQQGYNPLPGTFDLTPHSARFFVIKSYTEDDVHKSLKYEIWASTDKGNQRLDKAFRDSAHGGPIYLFYSVNASGHFCGMAQMLTPLDYSTSSNVWAQDGKWKGTFKVRWIFVKDLPNSQLRHIRLTNTQECKPVTQSRDTQELTSEAGREVLKIMSAYTSKTSLLQDFQYYEMHARQPVSTPSMAPPSAIPVPAAGSSNSEAPLGGAAIETRTAPAPSNAHPGWGVAPVPGVQNRVPSRDQQVSPSA